MSSAAPDISVIIATRNRAGVLPGALTHLAAQQTAPPAGGASGVAFTFEVIVVDNGSTDETRSVVRRAAEGFPVSLGYVYEPAAGKSWALNAGMQAATGTIFAFMDDDIEPSSGWLAAFWRCAQETGADAVTGRVLPKWTSPRPAWLTDEALQITGGFGSLGCIDYGDRRLRRQDAPGRKLRWVGGNVAMRRAAAERVGGWDVRMIRAQDTDYYWRSVRAGLVIVYEPLAVAAHRLGGERMTPAYFRQWRHRTGRYDIHLIPWRRYHAVTLLPLSWYRQAFTCAGQWVAATLIGRPWIQRFSKELVLREMGSTWWARAKALPQWWAALLTGKKLAA